MSTFNFAEKESYTLDETKKLLEQQNNFLVKELKTDFTKQLEEKDKQVFKITTDFNSFKIDSELSNLDDENAKIIKGLVGTDYDKLATVKTEYPNLFNFKKQPDVIDPFKNDKTDELKQQLLDQYKEKGTSTLDELNALMSSEYQKAKSLADVK